jgi:hypothetical protein
MAAGKLNALSQMPDDQAAAQWGPTVQELIKDHDVKPEDLQAACVDPNQYPGKQGVQNFVLGLNGYKNAIAQEQKNRETAATEMKAQAEADTSKATVADKNLDAQQKQRGLDASTLAAAAEQGPAAYQSALEQLPYGRARAFEGVTDPAKIRQLGMTPEQQVTSAATAAQRSETLRHDRADESNAAARLRVDQSRLTMEQQSAGFGPPGTVSPAAQMAADGRMDPATLRAMLRKNPGLVGQIQQVDPKWDEGDIDKRYDTIRDFANTSNAKAGGQSLALNTMIHHADLYLQTADALHNGRFTPGNAVYNTVSQMMGSPAPTNADLVARFLAGETAKLATGGAPAEGEVNGILNNLNKNLSPEGMRQAGQKLLEVAAGRGIPLMETVKDAKAQNVIHVIKPDAAAILEKNGYDSTTLKPRAPRGQGTGANGAGGAPWVQHNGSTGQYRYSTDGGKTWQSGQPNQ